ncbi:MULTISPECIES: hypothetical protein [unclassified Pseudofrankia]|nr:MULTISPECIES: hypothetical protein [unclassified Pseudofrankia]MDT3447017.1 hypothetical protein [Pseudofrankia sp. BMG5.37]
MSRAGELPGVLLVCLAGRPGSLVLGGWDQTDLAVSVLLWGSDAGPGA